MATRQRERKGRGSIRKRREGLFQGRITINGKCHTVSASTEAEVDRQLREIRGNSEKGLPPLDHRLTVGAFLKAWLHGPAKQQVRPTTWQAYRNYTEKHLIPELGHRPLVQLQPQHVDKFLADREAGSPPKTKGLSAKTCRQIRAILMSALSYAERTGQVHRNVARLATPPRLPHKEVEPFTAGEARRIVECARTDRLGPLYVLALDSGLRQGELLGLRWIDVDLENRTVRVAQTRHATRGKPTFGAPKSARSRRTVSIGETAAELLAEWSTRQKTDRVKAGPAWQDTGLVFTSRVGTPLDASNVSHRFRAFLVANGIAVRTFHSMRHTMATLALVNGHPLKVVSERLGHASIAITADTYGHVTAEQSEAIGTTLDTVLAG